MTNDNSKRGSSDTQNTQFRKKDSEMTTTKKAAPKKTTKTAVKTAAPKKSAKKTTLAADLEAGKILADAAAVTPAPVTEAEPELGNAKGITLVSSTSGKPLSKRDLKSLEKKAAIEAAAKKPLPEEKPAAKKAAKSAKKTKSADDALRVHLYGAGKVFLFSKLVAERIDGMPNMQVEISGKKLTLTPTKSAKDTTPITAHQGRSILRAGRILKDVEWSGKTQDLIAKPVGDHAFEVQLS